MRFLVILIVVLLAFYFFMPEPEPVPVEESFIGNQIKPLRKAEGVQEDYLKASEAKRKQLEDQLSEDGG